MAAVPSWLAGGLVFFTSAAVLVLEILAGRLLAPYVGIRLETYTAVIGTVLAGIAAGTWAGGRLADRVEPRRILGPLLVVGGILSLLSVPLVRVLGRAGGGGEQVLVLALGGFFAPAAFLSAVSPTVIKLQLRDLRSTGTVVGRLSALGTSGAIAGTFVAGFVLVAAAPTSTVIIVVGGSLVAVGLALWWRLGGSGSRRGALALLLVAGLAVAGAARGGFCDVETRYHCARIIEDEVRPGGRVLMLDVLRHSYVDLDDPTHLEFRYARVFADVVEEAVVAGGTLDALHVGGGGFSLPRYVAATHPESRHLVLELDPGLVDLARRRLGLTTGPRLGVRVGDARLLVRRLPDDGWDLVVGDAFGDLAVPWHLTTEEFLEDVERVLRPKGTYVLNVIDYPPLRFARAELATLGRVFDHVAVLAPPRYLAGEDGGNFVLVASDEPIDGTALEGRVRARSGEERVLVDGSAVSFADGSTTLRDDYAPVDQWLARVRSPGR